MKKNIIAITALFLSIICNAQIKTAYKTYLDKTLKNYTVYKKPIFVDLNADKKTDVAVIVFDSKKVALLYSILSDGNTFNINKEISDLDKQDLYIELCSENCDNILANQKNKVSILKKIFISSNEYKYILVFNKKTKHLEILYEKHTGP